MAATCKCGKGHVSKYDGKCGHCRTTKEQKDYVHKRVYEKPENNITPINT